MRNLGMLLLVTAALTPLAWVGVQTAIWRGRRVRWSDSLLHAVQSYALPIAVALALALAGLLGAFFR